MLLDEPDDELTGLLSGLLSGVLSGLLSGTEVLAGSSELDGSSESGSAKVTLLLSDEASRLEDELTEREEDVCAGVLAGREPWPSSSTAAAASAASAFLKQLPARRFCSIRAGTSQALFSRGGSFPDEGFLSAADCAYSIALATASSSRLFSVPSRQNPAQSLSVCLGAFIMLLTLLFQSGY